MPARLRRKNKGLLKAMHLFLRIFAYQNLELPSRLTLGEPHGHC